MNEKCDPCGFSLFLDCALALNSFTCLFFGLHRFRLILRHVLFLFLFLFLFFNLFFLFFNLFFLFLFFFLLLFCFFLFCFFCLCFFSFFVVYVCVCLVYFTCLSTTQNGGVPAARLLLMTSGFDRVLIIAGVWTGFGLLEFHTNVVAIALGFRHFTKCVCGHSASYDCSDRQVHRRSCHDGV
jgi:hypothetical protein